MSEPVKPAAQGDPPLVSVIVPLYNERDCLPRLLASLRDHFAAHPVAHEILLVNDGSRDLTPVEINTMAGEVPHVSVLHFRRNFGQTAAMAAGFKHARGQVIIPMDADLQNDPEDIPVLLAKLEEGYDVVSGWRRNRHDGFLARRLPSWVANRLISVLSGVHLHDYGCTLKAYRRDVMEHVSLVGEMHRFIPIHAHWQGARITEIPVRHHPRAAGDSKYGIGRTFRVLMDLLTVLFFGRYLTKPLHAFGLSGGALMGTGVLCGLVVLYQKWFEGVWAYQNPLLQLAVFLFLVGLQLVSMGLMAEILVRIYFEVRRQPPYEIQSVFTAPAD